MNEILTIVEKLGLPTLWGYLLYLLINKMMDNYNGRLEKITNSLSEIAEHIKEKEKQEEMLIDKIDIIVDKLDEIKDEIRELKNVNKAKV